MHLAPSLSPIRRVDGVTAAGSENSREFARKPRGGVVRGSSSCRERRGRARCGITEARVCFRRTPSGDASRQRRRDGRDVASGRPTSLGDTLAGVATRAATRASLGRPVSHGTSPEISRGSVSPGTGGRGGRVAGAGAGEFNAPRRASGPSPRPPRGKSGIPHRAKSAERYFAERILRRDRYTGTLVGETCRDAIPSIRLVGIPRRYFQGRSRICEGEGRNLVPETKYEVFSRHGQVSRVHSRRLGSCPRFAK